MGFSGSAPTTVTATVTIPAGASTSAKQDTGNTSLSSVDGKITACNTGAVTISGALPAGSNAIGTVAPKAHSSTDPGANISLSDTAAHQGASLGCVLGAWVSAPIANTKPIYIGHSTSVTTSTGIELNPGDREFFAGVTNTSQIWAITGTATQACHVLAN